MSKNLDEPKIQTYIAVKAGSSYDPKDNTGLAHYLEHMLFKGTSKIGTLDWEKEKVLLKRISDLYEKHKAESDPKKKSKIYEEIDRVSLEASNYSIASEYDKLISHMGATGTNAHTWVDETIYYNKIPSNELNNWLYLESERFGQLVLRLFHTELETVYEEFNRAQDMDERKVIDALYSGLFPTHPYGQQTTLGKAEHLRNPSMIAIHEYFNKYYVPNNMALILVGDLDFDKTIAEVDATFGQFKRGEALSLELPKEKAITAPLIKEVFGPSAQEVHIAFRCQGAKSEEEKFVTLANMILYNEKAGLIDINLIQKQLIQKAMSSYISYNDYGDHSLFAVPKEGQTLQQAKDLLLEQIEKLKRGEFEEWMIEAVVNDLKVSQMKKYQDNTSLAKAYYKAFIHNREWIDKLNFLDELKKITKEELVDFANKFYRDNYVCVFKRKGEDKSILKVKNPNVSPINLNRDNNSDFAIDFYTRKSTELKPKFIDYSLAIQKKYTKSAIEVSYIDNKINDLFELDIIFDMGKNNNRKLPLAIRYTKYLGTDKYSPEDLKKEFYKIGIKYSTISSKDRSGLRLTGLQENLHKGLELLEHFCNNLVPNQEHYDNYVLKIDKNRKDSVDSKEDIIEGLIEYSTYGENSSLRDIFSMDELKSISPGELVDLFKGMMSYKHRIFYYGKDVDSTLSVLDKYHIVSHANKLKDYPKAKEYLELETGNNVYFAQYDMVQCMILFLAKGEKFSIDNMIVSKLFNSYFGMGLSSIVFQEIREARSLAYSAYFAYSNPSHEQKSNYLVSFVGTQTDKMTQAIEAMTDLIRNMPESEKSFNTAKESVLKDVASKRITKSNIFWEYERLNKLGISSDLTEQIYDRIKDMTIEDLRNFFEVQIKSGSYDIMVIGNKSDINMSYLNNLGNLKEIDIHDLFNYEKA
ncbi:peptidase M16 [Ichthyobacterium seriolicida]|uniref:Peptidase M16 n=2 Tax=Ichthyobacterium seriolicida TaxID=242600 RepID=A0A1J1DYP9_9FLAO|nr:peptidase M16 [Ichthyobacterium seriolicida]